jgi:site-specific DNA recombinase
MTMSAAIYARVSSEQQAQEQTIASQLFALKERVARDELDVDESLCFLDEGYTGATLVRPGLERLRDQAASGAFDRLYVHSPDRLARRYAYQVLLVDELKRCGVELVFLNRAIGQSPEDDLLLQVQGMVAEYERAKILERSRRGKRHAARRGCVSVLCGAPYGYRYVGKRAGGGEARYEIVFEEARIVKSIFEWVGRDGCSIGEVCRRLKQENVATRTGKNYWDRTTVWGMLKNSAYCGRAVFGKTRIGEMRPRLRAQRGHSEQPRRAYSTYDTNESDRIALEVPAIVGVELFRAVSERLEENRQRNRQQTRGAKHLLQGLLVCQSCGYAYYGKPISLRAAEGKRRHYCYYRCVGSDAYRFGGERACENKQVRSDLLESAVWDDVRALLTDPDRVRRDFEQRLNEHEKQDETDSHQLVTQTQRVRRGLARLLDAYEDGLIEKSEFEPRMHRLRERMQRLESETQEAASRKAREEDMRRVIGHLEEFANRVQHGLEKADWNLRRELIRSLVKRVEVGNQEVRVVYRVNPHPFDQGPEGGLLQHCWRGPVAVVGEHRAGLSRLASRQARPPLRAVRR